MERLRSTTEELTEARNAARQEAEENLRLAQETETARIASETLLADMQTERGLLAGDQVVQLLDVQGVPRRLREWPQPQPAHSLVFDRTGSRLAAAGRDKLAGDLENYRRLCRDCLARFRQTRDPLEADIVCKICLLQPGTVELEELPMATLRKGLTAPEYAAVRPWLAACAALIAYRLGDWEEALEAQGTIGGEAHQDPLALGWIVRALSDQRPGRAGARLVGQGRGAAPCGTQNSGNQGLFRSASSPCGSCGGGPADSRDSPPRSGGVDRRWFTG
ncbi:MAG: hypothetical protein ACKV0T_30150 [Planctomycetales bacterium]